MAETQQLADLEDLETFGIASNALQNFTDAQKTAHLLAASGELLGYLSSDALIAWGNVVRAHCCAIAVYRMVCKRGFNPANPLDQTIRMNRDDAIAWAKDVSRGVARPADTIDATPIKLMVGRSPSRTDRTDSIP